MNCIVGYGVVASSIGKWGGAPEWCPGHIKFAGMNIDPGARTALPRPPRASKPCPRAPRLAAVRAALT